MYSYSDKFHLQGGELIRQLTFGMNDGVVSIFALLAGLSAAGQDSKTILITLIAASVAGALSMAAGEFISSKSEADYFNHEVEQESLEIELCPEIEKEELRQIYRKKGIRGELLEQVVEQICSNKELWVREMVIDELSTTEIKHKSDLKSSFIIFFAFIVGSCFPTLPYLLLHGSELSGSTLFKVATGVTVGGLFIAGALKRFVTGVNWIKSGFEMLLVGFFAFIVSYAIGLIIPF